MADVFDQFLYSMHKMLGHEVTARFLNVDAGDKSQCHLCHPNLCSDNCRDAHFSK